MHPFRAARRALRISRFGRDALGYTGCMIIVIILIVLVILAAVAVFGYTQIGKWRRSRWPAEEEPGERTGRDPADRTD